MKTRKIILSFFLVLFSLSLFAEKVEVEKAYQIAQNHIVNKTGLRNGQATTPKIDLVYTAKEHSLLKNAGEQETIYYYIFNINNDEGFVIVSGNDIAYPVLGYSFEGGYNTDNQSPGFAYFMQGLQNEIDYGIKQQIEQDEEISKQWEAYLSRDITKLRSTTNDSYLVQSKWDQLVPYNNLCPSVNGVKTVTGCVATVMAQIMYFYKYPAKGTGILPAYSYKTIRIPEVDLDAASNYDWDNMSNTYPTFGNFDPNNFVATLMYHCGVSVRMMYDVPATGGSGAYNSDAGRALALNFGYDKSIQTKQRAFYTNNEWHAMLKNEINAGRPVFYSGSDANGGGHAFICDGYNEYNYFHFNWGWGGYYDGFFLTSALNPGAGGAGSGSGVFSEGQNIILNIMPDAGGSKNYEMKTAALAAYNFGFYPSAITSINKEEGFMILAPIWNFGLEDFTGKCYLVLVDEDDNAIADIGCFDLDLAQGYGLARSTDCFVPSTVASGNYYIRIFTQANDESSKSIVYGEPSYTDRIPITVSNITNIGSSNLVFYQNFDITPAVLIEREGISVSCRVANTGSKAFYGSLVLGIYTTSGTLVQLVEEKELYVLASGYADEITFSNIALTTAGKYKLRLYAANMGENSSFLLENHELAKNNIDITITVPATHIKRYKNTEKQIEIYPNPATEYIIIKNKELQIKSAGIYQLSGVKVKEFATGSEQEIYVPLTNVASGMYILMLDTNDGIVNQKITKK